MTQQTSMTRPTEAHHDDEISISELLMKLWAKRGLIVFLPLLFVGLTLVGLLISKTSQLNEISMYVELVGISLRDEVNDSDSETDTESSSESSSESDESATTRYPNGTVFSPQDLANPTVIRMLAEVTGLNAKDLAENIDVQFGTPFSNGVLIEYKAALEANSRAAAQDLAALNARYERKLKAAATRGLKITVNYVNLKVSKGAGAQIAEKLLQLWNQVYTEQVITLLPSQILGLRWTNDFHDLTTPIGLQEASIQISAIETGIDSMLADGRIIGLLNMNNVSATDIKTYLSNFREIYFEPLFLAAFDEDTSLTRVYERDIAVQIKILNTEIDELNDRLVTLGNLGVSGQFRSGNRLQEPSPGLDGGALSQLVSLAEQASLAKYIEASLEEKYKLISEKARLQGRLERMRPESNVQVNSAVTGGFVEQAAQRYQNIVVGYDDLLTKAKEIAGSTTPSFYSITTQPDIGDSLIAERDLLFVVLAGALGGMLAVIAALVWPQRQTG